MFLFISIRIERFFLSWCVDIGLYLVKDKVIAVYFKTGNWMTIGMLVIGFVKGCLMAVLPVIRIAGAMVVNIIQEKP